MAQSFSAPIVRAADGSDVPAVLALLDRAAEWLLAHGRVGQWGSGRQSTNPHRLAQARTWPELDFFVAEAGGVVIGTLILADRPAWNAPPAGEPERYVRLLVSDPAWAGRGVGARLLERARAVAMEAGIRLLRLDCWAGGDGKLVSYYQAQGFTLTQRFTRTGSDGQPWAGALLEQRLGWDVA